MGVLNLYNELGKAQFERLSAAPAQLQGRFYFDILTLKPYIGDGTGYREILLNTDPLVIGTNGTAANNVRLYTTAPGTLTLLKGSETSTPPITPTNLANLTAFLLDCRVTTQLNFDQATATNPTGTVKAIYQKTDGYLYLRVPGGAEYPIIAQEVPVYLDWVQTTTPTNPAASRFRTYFKSDGYFYSLDSAGLERRIGSGGSAGINYDTNPDFEGAITGYTTYADAAGVAPVDGTGGSPSISFTRSTSSPLIGVASGLITKPASNCQGNGGAYAFTIDSGYQGAQLAISFLMQTSANYVAGDILMYIVDVTNGTVTQLVPYTVLKSDTLATVFTGTFQAAATSTSYRLCWHVATTNANAYTLKIDNVSISPVSVAFASAVTDWDASRTFTSSITTNVTFATRSRRVGDSLQVYGNWIFSGVNTQGVPTLVLPAGMSLDSSKLANSSSRTVVGQWTARNSGSGAVTTGSAVVIASTTTVTLEGANTSANVPYTIASGNEFLVEFTVPILGWGSNVQIGGYDGRTAAAVVQRSGTQSIANASSTVVVFNSLVYDTHGALNTSSGVFTAPVAGYYRVSSKIEFAANATGDRETSLFKNGSRYAYLGYNSNSSASGTANVGGSIDVQLAAGDTLDIRVRQTSGGALNVGNTATANYFSVSLLPGRSTLAVGDKIMCTASRTSSQSISNNTVTTLIFNADVTDTTGSLNTSTGVYTVPRAGTAVVMASTLWTGSATGSRQIRIRKGSSQVGGAAQDSPGANNFSLVCFAQFPVLAGDTIDVQLFQNSGGALNAAAGGTPADWTRLSIQIV